MKYAQTGIHAVSAVDGCPGHAETADPSDPHFAVDCPVHEAWIARTKDPLWAATPAQVPLTKAEADAAEAAKATFDAVAAQSVGMLAAALAGGGLNMAQVAGAVAPGGALAAVAKPPAAAKPGRPRRVPAKTAP